MGENENPDGIVTTDVGPDDDLGTADKAADVKADAQPKPNAEPQPDAGTSQPVTTEPPAEPAVADPTQPGPDEGQPVDGGKLPDESLDDVKKSRAYHQTKQQEETELRKEIEGDLAELRAELQQGDPSTNFSFGAPPDTAQEQQQEQQEQPDDAYVDPSQFNPQQFRKELLGDIETMIDGRDRRRGQDEINRKYAGEVKSTGTKLDAFVAKHKIPQEVQAAGLKYAERYINGPILGNPTRLVELAAEYMSREMTARAVKAQQKLATEAAGAADDLKIVAAKEIAQPSGGGISAPAPTTSEKLNEIGADDIVPDDTFD